MTLFTRKKKKLFVQQTHLYFVIKMKNGIVKPEISRLLLISKSDLHQRNISNIICIYFENENEKYIQEFSQIIA